MIDIFFRREATAELMHPRVCVAQVHDYEQAAALLSTFPPSDTETPLAAGRPARIRGTVAQLVKRRDAALDREMAALTVKKRRASVRVVG